MEKSPDAFRTITEVADWLGVPTHVLRFWESRFPQVKPVKRAGGRRYYRPADMVLLGGIKRLLHDDGMTIRGVQKMLREDGVRHVSSFSQPLDAAAPLRDVTPEEEEVAPSPMAVDVEPEPLDNVVPIAAEAPTPDKPDTPPEERLVLGPDTQAAEQEEAHAAPAGHDVPVPGTRPEEAPSADEAAVAAAADEMTPSVADAQAADEADEAPEDERLPTLSFLRRATPGEGSAAEPPQPDLFSSSRAAEAGPAAPRKVIPPTTGVPRADAPDDDPGTPAFPGLAARLVVHGIRPDHAAIARAVADLRAVRARL